MAYCIICDSDGGCLCPVAPPAPLTAAEALYGFMGWLTCRDQPITLSARHDAGIAADLVDLFIKANNLEDVVREGWHKLLKHPVKGPDAIPIAAPPIPSFREVHGILRKKPDAAEPAAAKAGGADPEANGADPSVHTAISALTQSRRDPLRFVPE